MSDFRMLSSNVRGLSNFKKRHAIFAWCRKQNANIIFFKEHIQLETMRNNGKLNGVPLWSLLMGVVIQEVLQYSFERGLMVILPVKYS